MLLAKTNINIQANNLIEINSKKTIVNSQILQIQGKTYLGKNANKKMVLGQDIKNLLEKIVQCLGDISQQMTKYNTHIHPHPMGPTTPSIVILNTTNINNKIINIKFKLKTILSENNFLN